jgi:hypothetical protein
LRGYPAAEPQVLPPQKEEVLAVSIEADGAAGEPTIEKAPTG